MYGCLFSQSIVEKEKDPIVNYIKTKKNKLDKIFKAVKKNDTLSLNTSKEYFRNNKTSKINFLKNLYSSQKDSITKSKLPSLFKWNSGQVMILQQIANREGNYPNQTPGNFTRFSLNGSANVFGIPLKLQYLNTTEQNIYARQPMNRFSVGFDALTWKKNMSIYAQKKMKEIERQMSGTEWKKLDGLYGFYDEMKVEFLNKNEFDNLLKKYDENKLLEEATKKIRGSSNKLKDSLYTEVKNNKHFRKLEKEKEKNQKKMQVYLDKVNMKSNDLRKIQLLQDSLKKINPEKLALYEQYMILKAIKDGNTTEAFNKIKKYGILSFTDKFLTSFKKLQIGTSYPEYSDFTIKNIAISGAEVEYQSNKLYLAAVGTKNLNPVPGIGTFQRQIQAGRIGVGLPEKTHLIFTLLQGADNPSSIKKDTIQVGFIDTTYYGKPRKNFVADVHGRWQINSKLSLDAELAQATTSLSIFKNQIQLSDVFQYTLKKPSDSTAIRSGKAINTVLKYQLTKAIGIDLKLQSIDGGFYSLGIPFMRNNVKGYEVKLSMNFWNQQFKIFPFYAFNEGSQQYKGKNLMYSYGIKLNSSFTHTPYWSLDYRVNDTKGFLSNTITLFNFTTGYAYKFRKTSLQTSLTISVQKSENKGTELVKTDGSLFFAQSSNTISVQETAMFNFPLQLSCQASLREITGGVKNTIKIPSELQGKWKTIGATASYTAWGVWQNSLGYNYSFNNNDGYRNELQLTTAFVFLKQITAQLRFNKINFNTKDQNNNYKESKIQISLSYKL